MLDYFFSNKHVKERINQIIVSIYEKNTFLLEGDVLGELEKEFFRSVNLDMKETTATQAIHIY